MPTVRFTEKEVRLAYTIAIAMGRNIDEINSTIIKVTAPNAHDEDGKLIPDSSILAKALATLRNAGYMD